MITLTTGEDSTLGNYKKLSEMCFGKDSGVVKFLESKIAESPNGEDEEVIIAESQMLFLLSHQISTNKGV